MFRTHSHCWADDLDFLLSTSVPAQVLTDVQLPLLLPALTSLIPNLLWTHATWRFWKIGGDKEARVAWRHGLWWLPVILALMMLHKQGMNWTQRLGLRETEEESSDSS